MPASPTSGFDRLNLEALQGIVPIGVPVFQFLTERPDSPLIEFSEQAFISHSFEGDWETCLNNRLARGAYLEDSFGNVNRVLTCSVSQRKGNVGTLTIKTESISFATPPDEFDYGAAEMNPAIEKSAKFTSPIGQPNVLLQFNDLIAIHQALEAPQPQARDENNSLNPYVIGPMANPDLAALWEALLLRLRRGEENFYMSGIKIIWSQFAFAPQPMDLGGVIEDPSLIIPHQFYIGPDGPVIPDGMSFLRQADDQVFQRTWWKITRKWVGFQNALWDSFIYS